MKRLRIYITFFCLISLIISGCKIKEGEQKSARQSDANQAESQSMPVSAKAAVDNSNPLIGDMIVYTLTVGAIPGISPMIPEMGSRITGLRIVDIGEEGPKKTDGRNVWKRWYKLQADFTGSYIIPPAKVGYIDPNGRQAEVSSAQIFIEVNSSIKEGEESRDILDIKPLEPIKNGLSHIYLFTGIGILLLAIAGIGIWLYLRKRRKEDAGKKVPPDETALRDMDALMASGYLKTGDYRSFYFRLSELLRAYMEARFSFPAQESTTEELIPMIEKLGLTRSQKDTVRMLARWEDLVKFAMHTTTNERAQKDWDDTRRIIIETRQNPSEEDRGYE